MQPNTDRGRLSAALEDTSCRCMCDWAKRMVVVGVVQLLLPPLLFLLLLLVFPAAAAVAAAFLLLLLLLLLVLVLSVMVVALVVIVGAGGGGAADAAGENGIVHACTGGRRPKWLVMRLSRLCCADKLVRKVRDVGICHPMQESLVLGQRGDELDGAEMPLSMPV